MSPSGQDVEAVAVSSTSMLVILVGLTRWRVSRPLSSVDLCSALLPPVRLWWLSVARKTADSVSLMESVLLFDLELSSSSRSMV